LKKFWRWLPRAKEQAGNDHFRFAEAMSEELANNRDKGGWDACTYSYLLRRAKQELRELERAIDAGKSPTKS